MEEVRIKEDAGRFILLVTLLVVIAVLMVVVYTTNNNEDQNLYSKAYASQAYSSLFELADSKSEIIIFILYFSVLIAGCITLLILLRRYINQRKKAV